MKRSESGREKSLEKTRKLMTSKERLKSARTISKG